MNIQKRMDKALKNAAYINFSHGDRFVIISDCHRGDGNWDDDFARNEHIYAHALNYYYRNGFTYIEPGDGDELWENRDFCRIASQHHCVFRLLRKFYETNRLYFIFGNHDMVKKNKKWVKKYFAESCDENGRNLNPLFPDCPVTESIVMRREPESGNDNASDIVIVHGHQADFFNDKLWRLSRFLVRYLWRPLENFGVNNPTGSAENHKKKNKIERKLIHWVKQTGNTLIAGHTHRPVFPGNGDPPYFNDGSCVHPRSVTALEIENGCATLVKWSVTTRLNGSLIVSKEIIAGPRVL